VIRAGGAGVGSAIAASVRGESVIRIAGKNVQHHMEQYNIRRLHQSAELIRSFLDRLDEQSDDESVENLRRSVRYRYRVRALNVEIIQPGTGSVCYEIPSRNLSCEGASFLLGHFAYPGSICRIQLVSLNNQRQTVTGTIVRCRYIEGSGTLHEVGVQFESSIDVVQFNRQASRLRGALINDEPGVRRLVEHWLKALEVDLRSIDNPGRLFDILNAEKFHFILLDMELTGFNALTLARELRHAGYIHTIVAATDSRDAAFHEQCLVAGCNRLLLKPFSAPGLAELAGALNAQPLFSTLADDGSLVELIGTFVHELGSRMTQLEKAYSDEDLESLAGIARTLRGEGGAHGFQAVTDAAAQVERALAAGKSRVELRQILNELMQICTSVRTK
jgi:CheY-like chemotaxis protein